MVKTFTVNRYTSLPVAEGVCLVYNEKKFANLFFKNILSFFIFLFIYLVIYFYVKCGHVFS